MAEKIKLRAMWNHHRGMWSIARSTNNGAGGWTRHSLVCFDTKTDAAKVIRELVKFNPDEYAEG